MIFKPHNDYFMQKLAQLFLFFSLLLNITIKTQAQHFEFGGKIFSTNYRGDIGDSRSDWGDNQFGFGGFVRYVPLDFLGFRLGLNVGEMSADDRYSNDPGIKQRGYKFKTGFSETNVFTEWYFLNHFEYFKDRSTTVAPYVFAGLTHIILTNRPRKADDTPIIADDFKPKRFLYGLGFGAGARCAVLDYLSVGLELGFRTPFSDYLDGISSAGNAGKNDWYIIGGLLVTYKLGDAFEKPLFKRR